MAGQSISAPPEALLSSSIQAQYDVLDSNNAPLEVQVDWDEADRLRVAVAEPPVLSTAEPTFSLAALPEA